LDKMVDYSMRLDTAVVKRLDWNTRVSGVRACLDIGFSFVILEIVSWHTNDCGRVLRGVKFPPNGPIITSRRATIRSAAGRYGVIKNGKLEI